MVVPNDPRDIISALQKSGHVCFIGTRDVNLSRESTITNMLRALASVT